MEFPLLFTPGRIGRLELKNRLVLAPMVRNYGDEHGRATDRYADHIARVAAGGVGAIILEASFVSPEGRGFVRELGLHDDAVIPGLRGLAEAAHAHGAAVGPQLYHAGRQTSSLITGTTPVAPSPIADPLMNEEPLELDAAGIARIVAAYGRAAGRARQARCDFVEVHGAHGYLITQFLSPFTNHRTDGYGGSAEARMRFLAEVLAAVRAEAGDMAVIVRLSGEEMLPGGLTVEDTARIAAACETLGADAVHISAGTYASYVKGHLIQPMGVPDAPLVPLAARVRREVGIPVIAVGKIRTPELAERVLAQGAADFVALGRPLLADPDWPVKALMGRPADIRRCIACNQGCIQRLFGQQDVWCTVNPECGREAAFAEPPGPARRVLVAGGGPAGMEAALAADRRGHHVTLHERGPALGGQLPAAATPPHRPGWGELLSDLVHAIDRSGVEVRLRSRVTPALVAEERPDVVVLATGSEPAPPAVAGADPERTMTGLDVLEGRRAVGHRAIVAGGGCSGAQVAELLATGGHQVTLVEMTDAVALDAPLEDRAALLERLGDLGVRIRTGTRILGGHDGDLVVQTGFGVDALPYDSLVVCMGQVPVDGLADAVRALGPEVHVVGDAAEPRRVTDAMAEGALAGLAAG